MAVLFPLSLSAADRPSEPAAEMYGLPAISLRDFNRLAAQAGVEVFWAADEKNPGVVDADELAILGTGGGSKKWVEGGRLAKGFESVYRKLVEMRRREVVRAELDQGLPTLVASDLSRLPAPDREFAKRIIKAAGLVESLHIKQSGALAFVAGIKKADPESRAAFFRNQGPWCRAAKTEHDPFCNALPDFPRQKWDTYPADENHDQAMCKKLAALPEAKDVMAPFAVVRKEKDRYVAVPIVKAYAKEMKAIAAELRGAVKALDQKDEAALAEYVMAAAKAFEDGNWEPADEAWAKMNAQNSKWYLRVAPDEVYWDVCQEKAGFHVSFALIDKSSLELQTKLMPIREEMESLLEKLSGDSYKARKVQFKMPDFIEIVINAGDARSPLGATIGQSLPNWGKVAAEGRGRTVVMTNLYQDALSKKLAKEKAATLLWPATLANYSDDKLMNLIDIVLHEATHNLGPHSDYKIGGKGPSDVFGGGLASTLEELKAQTGSLLYTEMLRKKGIITDQNAKEIYTHALVWAFGHISQGMFTASGNPKNYSQLAAVQVGWLADEGALQWSVETDLATGKPVGKFNLVYDKIVPAVGKLASRVVRIKATGDVEGARALIEPYVSGAKKAQVHHEEIAERLLRFPRASMVYSVRP
jgi:hypothetical protein